MPLFKCIHLVQVEGQDSLPNVGQPVLPCLGVELRNNFQLSVLHSLTGKERNVFKDFKDEMNYFGMFTGWSLTWLLENMWCNCIKTEISHSHQPTCIAFWAISSQRTNHCFFRRGSMISPERLRQGRRKQRETTNLRSLPHYSAASIVLFQEMKESKEKRIITLLEIPLRLRVCDLYTDGLCTKLHARHLAS